MCRDSSLPPAGPDGDGADLRNKLFFTERHWPASNQPETHSAEAHCGATATVPALSGRGNKFIVQDDSGRTLVDTDPRGDSVKPVAKGEAVTVQAPSTTASSVLRSSRAPTAPMRLMARRTVPVARTLNAGQIQARRTYRAPLLLFRFRILAESRTSSATALSSQKRSRFASTTR